MVEVENLWRNLWPELLRWGEQLTEMLRTLDPVLLAILAAPAILALLFRSFTAFLLTLVLAAIALFSFQVGTDPLFRWALTALTVLAGLLAVVLAAMLRRRRRQVHRMDLRLGELRRELDDLREKYDGEIYWRRATERVAAGETG
ncbi:MULTISPECIES: hypothetical protein [Microvirga]|uniref:hypothetical protein n=1 Tax=Microvirga TaxID=186650 RepID=UPI001CFF6BDB|nr:hypothetical protein [Microvirga lenta]MCB5175370.1 hypothetical protein [Microvirga lenta]